MSPSKNATNTSNNNTVIQHPAASSLSGPRSRRLYLHPVKAAHVTCCLLFKGQQVKSMAILPICVPMGL